MFLNARFSIYIFHHFGVQCFHSHLTVCVHSWRLREKHGKIYNLGSGRVPTTPGAGQEVYLEQM